MNSYKLSTINKRLSKLQNNLDKEYFGIQKAPNHLSGTKDRYSIYTMEQNKDYLQKVIIVQRLSKRWLNKIHTYKKEHNIPLNDPVLDDIVHRMRKLKGWDTLRTLKHINDLNNGIYHYD